MPVRTDPSPVSRRIRGVIVESALRQYATSVHKALSGTALYDALAEDFGCSRATIERALRGEPIERPTAALILDAARRSGLPNWPDPILRLYGNYRLQTESHLLTDEQAIEHARSFIDWACALIDVLEAGQPATRDPLRAYAYHVKGLVTMDLAAAYARQSRRPARQGQDTLGRQAYRDAGIDLSAARDCLNEFIVECESSGRSAEAIDHRRTRETSAINAISCRVNSVAPGKRATLALVTELRDARVIDRLDFMGPDPAQHARGRHHALLVMASIDGEVARALGDEARVADMRALSEKAYGRLVESEPRAATPTYRAPDGTHRLCDDPDLKFARSFITGLRPPIAEPRQAAPATHHCK